MSSSGADAVHCNFPGRIANHAPTSPSHRMAKAATAPKAPKAKAAKTKAAAKAAKPAKAVPATSAAGAANTAKAVSAALPSTSAAGAAADVVITSSKVCQAFAKRADAIAAAVKAAKHTVVVDAQPALGRNPDRGSFIVVVRGKTLVDLKAMPRPFTAMKALDIDAVSKSVLAALL